MTIDGILRLDKKLFVLLNTSFSNSLFDFLFPYITDFDTWVLPAIVLIYFFYKKENTKALYVLALSIILVCITDPLCVRIIKHAFNRLRPSHPDVYIESARYLVGRKASLSFPSAHAMNIFAQATLFTLFYKDKWVYFMSFASLIGFSRIYVGVHYPLDVFGGAALGALCGAILFYSAQGFIHSRYIASLQINALKHISNAKKPQ
jgi:undecaprenyl-diphosphatase